MSFPILYVNDAVEVGGGERNLICWIQGLKNSPWEPIVTCPREGTFSEVIRDAGIPIEWISLPDMRKLKDVPRGVLAWWQLNEVVRKNKVRIIHANSPPWFPIGHFVAKWNGIASAVSVQSRLEDRRVRQFFLTHADLLFTVSDSLRVLVENAGVPKGKTKTIYSSVDMTWFNPRGNGLDIRTKFGIGSADFVVGCVANIAYYKGHDILIQAFAKILDKIPNVHCLFVGRDDSDFAQRMKALVHGLGLTRYVHFVGFHSDARPYFEAIDLIVLPSRVEGAPVALLEAMSMERALIASSVDGTPEIVKDGETGVLIPPENHEKVVEAVIALYDSPERREKMGKSGRKWVAKFSSQTAHKTLLNGYSKFLPCA